MARTAFSHGRQTTASRAWSEAFRQGLRELGWIEGQTVTIEYRAEGNPQRLPALARDLIQLKVDVIVTPHGSREQEFDSQDSAANPASILVCTPGVISRRGSDTRDVRHPDGHKRVMWRRCVSRTLSCPELRAAAPPILRLWRFLCANVEQGCLLEHFKYRYGRSIVASS